MITFLDSIGGPKYLVSIDEKLMYLSYCTSRMVCSTGKELAVNIGNHRTSLFTVDISEQKSRFSLYSKDSLGENRISLDEIFSL